MPQSRKPLTAKQARFVVEYLVDLNATQAAIRAGYSARSANVTGTQNLAKPSIAQSIADAARKVLDKIETTAEQTLLETSRIARSDVRRLFTKDGRLKPLHMLDEATAASIASFKVIEKPGLQLEDGTREVERVCEVRFWDKNSALERLHKHHSLATPGRDEHTIQREVSRMSDEELEAALVSRLGEKAAATLGIRVVPKTKG